MNVQCRAKAESQFHVKTVTMLILSPLFGRPIYPIPVVCLSYSLCNYIFEHYQF